MPPGGFCNRCGQVQPSSGDTWCAGCTAWEATSRELRGSWDQSGCRALAADLVINCVRQVRALRSLGSGLARVPDSEAGDHRGFSAGSYRADVPRPPSVPCEVSRAPQESLPRKRRGPSPAAKEEDDSPPPDPPSRSRRPDGRGPPPDPDSSLRVKFVPQVVIGSRARDHGGHRSEHQFRKKDKDRTRSRRKPAHRAGRKHQRLGRLAFNPFQRVHRKACGSFLDLSTA